MAKSIFLYHHKLTKKFKWLNSQCTHNELQYNTSCTENQCLSVCTFNSY